MKYFHIYSMFIWAEFVTFGMNRVCIHSSIFVKLSRTTMGMIKWPKEPQSIYFHMFCCMKFVWQYVWTGLADFGNAYRTFYLNWYLIWHYYTTHIAVNVILSTLMFFFFFWQWRLFVTLKIQLHLLYWYTLAVRSKIAHREYKLS